ncbi:hypothetical protein HPB49_000404 [Dermacentor silvarum]|uniref:Uncharacterized protein n=1 Tax=Dermacentor silvarum TaxID=543639 RepID=A0ACB8CIV6_DERSI|nr:hypothetical protein HPB49_000404 [Dermacentor silvarum]
MVTVRGAVTTQFMFLMSIALLIFRASPSRNSFTAARDPLVIVEDFNAPSLHWGYHCEKARGRKLKERISTLGLTLLTDPACPTRPSLPLSSPDGYSAWAAHALSTQRSHTRVIQTTQAAPAVDPHLLHLWDARRGLLHHWRRHKLNRKLKAGIAALTEEASDGFQVDVAPLSEPSGSLFHARVNTTTTAPRSARLADKLRDRYLCRMVDLVEPEYQYSGRPNPELDAPFTLPDLQAALAKIRRGTARGHDCITVTLLANLPDSAYLSLLHLMNSQRLQQTASTVDTYATSCGLECAPPKSARLSLSSLPPPRLSLPSGPIPVKLWVAPLPRNMDTVSHPGRRAARVRALTSQCGFWGPVFPGISPRIVVPDDVLAATEKPTQVMQHLRVHHFRVCFQVMGWPHRPQGRPPATTPCNLPDLLTQQHQQCCHLQFRAAQPKTDCPPLLSADQAQFCLPMAHPTAPELQEGVDSPCWFCRSRHAANMHPHVARDAPRGGGESPCPEAATPLRLDHTDTPPSASFRHLWIMNEYHTQPGTRLLRSDF